VDDQLAARYSVWALLRWKREIRVIETADNSAQARAQAERHRPHVCLISATLGQGESLTLASFMKHLKQPPRVVIFADAIDAQLAGAAIVAGADAVLCRYADPEHQASVIRRAASGEQHFPNLRSTEVLALLGRVEDRDRAIVAMLLERTRRDDIARTLGISAHAVERRHQSILKRLADTRARDDDDRQDKRSQSSPLDCQRRSRFTIGGEFMPRAG